MQVYNPNTLPSSLIQIAAYYHDQARMPFQLIGAIRDPFANTTPLRRRYLGEYWVKNADIFLYLGRIQANHTAIKTLPPLMETWLALLEVLLRQRPAAKAAGL